jgi:hypothetical protein
MKIAEAKESLSLWLPYPMVDELRRYTSAHQAERETPSDGGHFGAEMSFSIWSEIPCT